MKRRLWIIVFWASLAVTAGGGVAADELLDSAGAFFKSYVDGGNRADLYIIDYFADDARIVAVRHLREGGTAKIGTTGEKHKKFLMKMRRHARAIKTTTQTLTTFSDVAYNLENGCVRITALRHVTPKETTTPYSLLICKNDSNEWRIKEELIEIKELPNEAADVQP